ncbi:MAG: cytidine deaminase [Lutibacter sp.]|nr:cytidine deaminase [Lutibacter sp.]MBP9602050.1 cytidine deaminase [Lutibacter sp.]
MKKIEINTEVTIFNSIQELPEEIKKLMNAAKHAKENAYAPYSKFKVGAAFLLENGKMVSGNNQENAAYPSGMCAERVAIWKVASEFPSAIIKSLAITASSSSQLLTEPVAPCGGCRQTMLEYELKQEQPIEIYFMGEEGKVLKMNSILDLLPIAFDKSFL